MKETKNRGYGRFVKGEVRERARSCLKNKRQTRKRQEGSVSSLKVGSGTKSDSEREGESAKRLCLRVAKSAGSRGRRKVMGRGREASGGKRGCRVLGIDWKQAPRILDEDSTGDSKRYYLPAAVR